MLTCEDKEKSLSESQRFKQTNWMKWVTMVWQNYSINSKNEKSCFAERKVDNWVNEKSNLGKTKKEL